MNDSLQNRTACPDEKSPQFSTNENFIPLDFSSPINQRQREECSVYPSQQQNFEFFSAKRTNFRKNNRNNRYQPSNRWSYENKGHQNYQQQRNNRKVRQQKSPCASEQFQSVGSQTPCKQTENEQSYFHPSMLEDPWKNLIANLERKKGNWSQEAQRQSLPRTEQTPAGQSPAQSTDSKEE